ncbi:MAG: transketolase C-terminal domain-containing protein [Catenulispora sp.]
MLYEPGERFPIGGSRTLHARDDDRVALLAAGVTVHECLKAREILAAEGIGARIVDLYSVKPLDAEAVAQAAADTGAIVVVEDHHPEGGLGEAVLSALAECGAAPTFGHLAVRSMPDSRAPEEQLEAAGISAAHIVTLARQVASGR